MTSLKIWLWNFKRQIHV